jgi:hypothetical protein
MAATAPLVFTDGFDHLNATQDDNKWTSNPWVLAAGRSGSGNSVSISNQGQMVNHYFTEGYRAFVVGFAFKFSVPNTTMNPIFRAFDAEGGNTQITLRKLSSNVLELRRGALSETLLATGTKTLLHDTWYFVELYVYIDSTSGRYQLRIDGVDDIALASSQNTQDNTNEFHSLSWAGENSHVTYVDDLYIRAKTTDVTTPADEFLGDINIRTLYPDANGTTRDFTPSSGTDDFAVVDETPASESDYLSSSTPTDMVTIGAENLSSGRAVHAVSLNTWVGLSVPGSNDIKHVVRSNVTNYLSSETFALSENARNEQSIWETDPDTGVAWIEAGFNSAEFGIEIQ